MPATKEQLRRLMELDRFFQKGKQWKASELLQKLADEADIQISDRTLKDDLAYLNSESGGILGNRKIGREWFWLYTDTTYSHFKKSLLPTEFNDLRKMVTTFKDWGDLPFWQEIEVMLTQFSNRFVFDDRPNRKLIEFQKPISTGGEQWLKILYEHIDNQTAIQVFYQSLRSGRNVQVDVYPLLLKEYNNRWWLVGWTGKQMSNIALESIFTVKESQIIFASLPNFDPNTYFENVLGVTVNPGSVQTIRLKVAADSVNYLRTKQIHSSQKEENEKGTEITLKLIPNFELQQAILQYGNKIEVLEPESLRKIIGEVLKDGARIYFNNQV